MKKGFTIVEVSILLVIFLIVAFLVAPLSLNDTMQAKNISRWRNVQADFTNIAYSITAQNNNEDTAFEELFNSILDNEVKGNINPYKITFINGSNPTEMYKFNQFKTTFSNATFAVKIFNTQKDDLLGILMYDVNGKNGPNVWGRDVFGLNIYKDRFEAFGKNQPVAKQKEDCSRNGTGLMCSNYYLIGGNFD